MLLHEACGIMLYSWRSKGTQAMECKDIVVKLISPNAERLLRAPPVLGRLGRHILDTAREKSKGKKSTWKHLIRDRLGIPRHSPFEGECGQLLILSLQELAAFAAANGCEPSQKHPHNPWWPPL
jgi:hypothetical protein